MDKKILEALQKAQKQIEAATAEEILLSMKKADEESDNTEKEDFGGESRQLGRSKSNIQYGFRVFPLTEDDGGGFYAEVPDLIGCMAAGNTLEETLETLEEAIENWIFVTKEKGKGVPAPLLYNHSTPIAGEWIDGERLAKEFAEERLSFFDGEILDISFKSTSIIQKIITEKIKAYLLNPDSSPTTKAVFPHIKILWRND